MFSSSHVSSTDRLSFKEYCLVESLRVKEATWGPVEDAAETRRSMAKGGSFVQRIVCRAQLIAQREGLDQQYDQIRQLAVLALPLLMLVAVVTGVLAAYGVLGNTGNINVLTAVSALLALNVLSFIGWGISLGWPKKADTSLNPLGRLWLWLTKRFVRGPEAGLMLGAGMNVLGRHGLARWVFGTATHLLWFCATFAAILALLWAFSARRYGFNWETTLLSPEHFVSVVQSLGALPSLLGFSVPDAELIHRSDGLQRLSASEQRLWSGWVLGCLVAYGLLPRLLALLFCGARWLLTLRALHIDTSMPGFAEHRDRLMPMAERVGIDAQAPADRVETVQPVTVRPDINAPTLVVGVELADTKAWPPSALPPAWEDAGVVDSRAQRQQLLQRLQQQQAAHLVLVCDAHQTPDRGVIAWLSELRAYGEQCSVVLYATAQQPDNPERLQSWLYRLEAAGFESEQIFSHFDALLLR